MLKYHLYEYLSSAHLESLLFDICAHFPNNRSMFSGIVEQLGTVKKIESQGEFLRFSIDLGAIAKDAHDGDSISINGVCLTIEKIDANAEAGQFGVMQETLRKTNLGELKEGARLNLERSMKVGDRISGHFVLGHVDGTGTIANIIKTESNCEMTFTCDPALTDQMVTKGSVALDGTSLTLVTVESGKFSVAFIPYTLEHTVFGTKRQGDRVNIEVDYLGKWIKKLIPEHLLNK